jgi:ABC-type dipeptide/oligopeptide/nickel transport system ATPase component
LGPDGKWKRTGKPIRMVTQDSATSFMPEEEVHNQIAIYGDHSNIVTFTGRTDKNYLTVRSKLREVLEKVPAILLQRNARTANSM